MMITKKTDLTELYDFACKQAEKIVLKDEEFRVRDLFTGVEWDRIPKSFRTKLGAMFLLYVNGDNQKRYVPIRKTPQNQQIYQKQKD